MEKLSILDKAICGLSPQMGMRRLAAKRVLHEYRYDGAASTSKRGTAPQNMSPNSFDVQRDRLQLMREAEDMERNFAPAMMLNRKVSMYCSPISYHATTGDSGLSAEVEEYLNDIAFKECDITRRYDFFKMLEFGMMGMNRSGDYGWAFMRDGYEDGMDEVETAKLPLKIQAVEADRIGGVYQNVVTDDYVSGCIIGKYGEITDYRVFQRGMATNQYTNPVDVPAKDFVHLTDTMRIDQYRGVSKLATAIQNLRDLYEMIDFVKGKAKLASALTVFTNSNGAVLGNGAMDAYATNIFNGNAGGLQQDIEFGQINHLQAGSDIKFPSSNSPSSEEQALMQLLLKFVAMSYCLPYSFALDASALGGVSSRLESEMAKAEFNRLKGVLSPHADRIKNMFLADAVAKGYFKMKDLQRITKGRWGYRSHPQPDIGREATASIGLYETGLLDPMEYWVDNAQDPESVASNMMRWHQIKAKMVDGTGFKIEDVFGNGMAKPLATSESASESISKVDDQKGFSTRKEFKESDSSINERIKDAEKYIKSTLEEIEDYKDDIRYYQEKGDSEAVQKIRIEIDNAKKRLSDQESILAKLKERRERRDTKKPDQSHTPKESKAEKEKVVNDRHALVIALMRKGHGEQEAYAIAYDIIQSGQFDKSKLPSDIQSKYYS